MSIEPYADADSPRLARSKRSTLKAISLSAVFAYFLVFFVGGPLFTVIKSGDWALGLRFAVLTLVFGFPVGVVCFVVGGPLFVRMIRSAVAPGFIRVLMCCLFAGIVSSATASVSFQVISRFVFDSGRGVDYIWTLFAALMFPVTAVAAVTAIIYWRFAR